MSESWVYWKTRTMRNKPFGLTHVDLGKLTKCGYPIPAKNAADVHRLNPAEHTEFSHMRMPGTYTADKKFCRLCFPEKGNRKPLR